MQYCAKMAILRRFITMVHRPYEKLKFFYVIYAAGAKTTGFFNQTFSHNTVGIQKIIDRKNEKVYYFEKSCRAFPPVFITFLYQWKESLGVRFWVI